VELLIELFWEVRENKHLEEVNFHEIVDYHSEVDKLCAMFQFVIHQAMQSAGSVKCYIQNRTKHGFQSTHFVEIVCRFPLFCSVWDQF